MTARVAVGMTAMLRRILGRALVYCLKAKAVPVVCVVLAMCAFLALHLGNYNKLPWAAAVNGDSFSYAAQGYEGEYYAIDSGEARLLSFDGNGGFRWDAEPGTVLRLAAPSPSGKVWVTSYAFNDSERIIRADILEYDRHGRRGDTLLSRSYEGADSELPVYTSGYLGLVCHGQWLYYMEKHPSDVTLYRVDTGLKAPVPEILSVFPYPEAETLTLSAACDPESGAVYTADKLGVVRALSPDGKHRELDYPAADTGEGFSLPYGLCVSGGVLYVSDVGRRQLYRTRDGGGFEPAADLGAGTPMETDCRLYYWISGTPEGQVLLISRYDLRRYDGYENRDGYENKDGYENGAGYENIEGYEVKDLGAAFVYDGGKRALLWIWWIFAGILALGALRGIGWIFMYAYRRMGMERLMSSVMLATVATVVTALVMAQYSDSFNKRFSSITMDNLSALSSMTAAAIDGDALMRIDGLDAYGGEDYEKLRKQLAPIYGGNIPNVLYEDETFRYEAADWDQGIYRMLLRMVNGRVCYVYSSADQWGAIYPMDYPYVGTEFQIAYEQGIQIVFPSVVDYSGEYTYTLTPVRNARGEVVGALEMGVNLRAFRREMFETLREIALRAAITVCVVLLLLKELVFAAEVFKNRMSREKKPLLDADAVRPLVFLLYLLDCFALVVSPLFARSLYTETLGIPMEVGVAVAYSATFFFLGIAAVAGGWACERVGLFPLLILGTALLFAGELTAAASGSLRMFVASRALVGMGVGLGHNCADVIAAAQKNPLDVERGFSMSNVGYNSGTNCGLVIGTAVGLLWGYRSVYLASALIAVLMLGYILLIFRGTGAPGAGMARRSDASDVRRRRGAGFIRFITSPRVLGFFLLALFPYMLCNAFTYYFLPLTGATYGLGEENISRIIFVYGMVSIYIGPALTRKLLEKFRVKAALGLGGLLIALALLLYAAAPVLGVLLASTAMFAVADSFSFTSQSLYFARLPETLDYGSGAALGVNNVISGLAQSLSSYCFAAAMVLGTRAGLGVIGLGMGILLMLFLVITRGERDFATVGRREGAEI